MLMLGIHAKSEQFSTPYASYDTPDHLPAFLTDKTTENKKLVRHPNNLACCLELVIQGHEKIGVILRMSGNNVLSDGAFWPTRTPSIEHGLCLDILKITPTSMWAWVS